jgi:hypothetical protein
VDQAMPVKADNIPADRLQAHRARTYRLTPDRVLRSETDAVDFVDERGFVLFWPIQGIEYPSLWAAVAGDRPVANEHDDPGHVTWRWKDGLLNQRRWYYAKIIRGKATMVSLQVMPSFYALSENYGEPESDYLEQYYAGKLSQPAKSIFEALLEEGPLDTIQLRKAIQMTSQASKSIFDRTLTELQRDFKILPVGVSDSGAWRYCFLFDLVHRFYPEIPEMAKEISTEDARLELARRFFTSLGMARQEELQKFFSWTGREAKFTIETLAKDGFIRPGDSRGKSLSLTYFLSELYSG